MIYVIVKEMNHFFNFNRSHEKILVISVDFSLNARMYEV
jgi:hypothetical protein